MNQDLAKDSRHPSSKKKKPMKNLTGINFT